MELHSKTSRWCMCSGTKGSIHLVRHNTKLWKPQDPTWIFLLSPKKNLNILELIPYSKINKPSVHYQLSIWTMIEWIKAEYTRPDPQQREVTGDLQDVSYTLIRSINGWHVWWVWGCARTGLFQLLCTDPCNMEPCIIMLQHEGLEEWHNGPQDLIMVCGICKFKLPSMWCTCAMGCSVHSTDISKQLAKKTA